MKLAQKLFLEALKASLENKKITWDFMIPEHIWKELLSMAELHKVLPLIFDAVNGCPAAEAMDRALFEHVRKRSMWEVVRQIQQTSRFLEIYRDLGENHIRALAVKGVICRQLYPNPDLRFSSDEDLLVEENSFMPAIEHLLQRNLQPFGMPDDFRHRICEFAEADEIGLLSEDHRCYIELHKNLFTASSEAYGSWNQYFADIFEDPLVMEVQGIKIYTPKPEKHLFYLICHALKHFLHSGVGIRQVCDMIMFANAYGTQIDWMQLVKWCEEIHAMKFTASIFMIGKKYLNFDEAKAGYPELWKQFVMDETALLQEILDSGIYGGSTMSRRHSSNITLEAAASKNRGENVGNLVLKTIFPKAPKLEHQYTYLKKHPYLLPVAWGERLLKYQREIVRRKEPCAIDAVRIGNQRMGLLKEYGILETEYGK